MSELDTPDTPVMGHEVKVSIGGTPMAAKSCGLVRTDAVVAREGFRGTRSHNKNDSRVVGYKVAGAVVLEPSMAEFKALLTLACGGTELQEEIADFTVIVDKGFGSKTYSGCKINKFQVTGQQGGMLEVTLDIIGKTAADTGTVGDVESDAPLVFSDITLTIDDIAREVQRFDFALDNMLASDRFMNSTTVTTIPEQDRVVTLGCLIPVANNDALLAGTEDGEGWEGSLAINDGATTVTLTFPCLQTPPKDPPIEGKNQEIMEQFDFKAVADDETEMTWA